MSNLQDTTNDGTLSLYESEERSEEEVDIGAGELVELVGGREVMPTDLPLGVRVTGSQGGIGQREVIPVGISSAGVEVMASEVKRAAGAKAAKGVKAAPGVKTELIETLAAEGQWKKLCLTLGAPENHGKLPARLALIYAVALNEVRVPGAPSEAQGPDIERFAQVALGALLQVDAKGPLVRMIVKRLMRRSWRSAPAPPTRTSVLLIIAAIMLGGFIGFLLGPGKDWFEHM